MGFTLLSEMPSYLTDILGFDLGSAGILCVFPYAALFMSTLAFARGFDYLQRECDWPVDRVRKTAMLVAYMGSATGLLICGFLPGKYAAYTFMVLSQVRVRPVLPCCASSSDDCYRIVFLLSTASAGFCALRTELRVDGNRPYVFFPAQHYREHHFRLGRHPGSYRRVSSDQRLARRGGLARCVRTDLCDVCELHGGVVPVYQGRSGAGAQYPG
jgi:hypothetical protein